MLCAQASCRRCSSLGITFLCAFITHLPHVHVPCHQDAIKSRLVGQVTWLFLICFPYWTLLVSRDGVCHIMRCVSSPEIKRELKDGLVISVSTLYPPQFELLTWLQMDSLLEFLMSPSSWFQPSNSHLHFSSWVLEHTLHTWSRTSVLACSSLGSWLLDYLQSFSKNWQMLVTEAFITNLQFKPWSAVIHAQASTKHWPEITGFSLTGTPFSPLPVGYLWNKTWQIQTLMARLILRQICATGKLWEDQTFPVGLHSMLILAVMGELTMASILCLFVFMDQLVSNFPSSVSGLQNPDSLSLSYGILVIPLMLALKFSNGTSLISNGVCAYSMMQMRLPPWMHLISC